MYAPVDSGSLNTEFGNITVWFKALLLRCDWLAVSAGIGVNFPTADDVRLYSVVGDATPLASLQNDSYHVNPFLGLLFTPNRCFFAQCFGAKPQT